MTRFSKSVKALALSVALMTSASLAFAQEPATSGQAPAKPCAVHKHKKHHRKCGMMQKLGLSQEQRETLKTKHQALRQENATLIADMKAKFQQLRALPKTPENQAQRDQLRAELKKSRQALRAKHEAVMQEVLTPEQLERYKAMKQQCKAEWQKKRQEAKSKKG